MVAPWVVQREEKYLSYRDVFTRVAAANGIDPQQYLERALAENGWNESLSEYDNLRSRRLVAYLRHRQPDTNLNGSILIYRLGQNEIEQALDGPPAELNPDGENPYQ
jgi:hypothetical protein